MAAVGVSLRCPPPCLVRQSSTEPGVPGFMRLLSPKAHPGWASLHPWCWDYTWALPHPTFYVGAGIRIQVFTLLSEPSIGTWVALFLASGWQWREGQTQGHRKTEFWRSGPSDGETAAPERSARLLYRVSRGRGYCTQRYYVQVRRQSFWCAAEQGDGFS